MLQLFPCPKCQQATALDSGLNEDAELQCPHCDAEFVLKDLLLSLPQWKVTRLPANGSTVAPIPAEYPDGTVKSSTELAAAPEVTEDDEGEDEELELSPVDASGNKKPVPDWSSFEPITHEQFERNRRQQRSPIWSVLQIALGGLAAFPIALLILWHGFGRDIADIGPKVAAYAPWIVPTRFHPYENSDDSNNQRPALSSNKPKKGDSGFRNFDSVLPPLDEPNQSQSGKSQTNQQSNDDLTQASMSRPETKDLPEVKESAKSTPEVEPESSKGLDEERPVDKDMSIAAPSAEQKSTGSNQDSANVFELIRRGENNLESWAKAYPDKTQLRTIAKPLYSNLTAIAESIAQLPSGNPILRTVRDQMREIGRTVKQRDDVQQLIQRGCTHELSQPHPAETAFGLAIIVSISEVEQLGDVWLLQSDSDSMPDSAKLSTISVPKRLAPALSTGKKLFLLGTVTKQSEESGSPDAPTMLKFSANYLYGL